MEKTVLHHLESRLLFCSFAIDPRQPNDFVTIVAVVFIELGAIAGVEIAAAVVVVELEAMTGVEVAAAAVVVELGATAGVYYNPISGQFVPVIPDTAPIPVAASFLRHNSNIPLRRLFVVHRRNPSFAGVEIVAAVVVVELEAMTGVEVAAAAVVVELGATAGVYYNSISGQFLPVIPGPAPIPAAASFLRHSSNIPLRRLFVVHRRNPSLFPSQTRPMLTTIPKKIHIV